MLGLCLAGAQLLFGYSGRYKAARQFVDGIFGGLFRSIDFGFE